MFHTQLVRYCYQTASALLFLLCAKGLGIEVTPSQSGERQHSQGELTLDAPKAPSIEQGCVGSPVAEGREGPTPIPLGWSPGSHPVPLQ